MPDGSALTSAVHRAPVAAGHDIDTRRAGLANRHGADGVSCRRARVQGVRVWRRPHRVPFGFHGKRDGADALRAGMRVAPWAPP